jgi:hypothetical protein
VSRKTKTNLVIIFGPPAVGKMTVGKELAKLTGYKLFHNHKSLDFAFEYFDFENKSHPKISEGIRFLIFREIAKSDLKGLIFTFVWAFGLKKEEKYVDRIARIFKKEGGKVYFVELETDLNTRLKRNVTPHRLAEKPSKRNKLNSRKNLLELEQKYQMNTENNKFGKKPYIKIDNSHLSPRKTALIIKKKLKI